MEGKGKGKGKVGRGGEGSGGMRREDGVFVGEVGLRGGGWNGGGGGLLLVIDVDRYGCSRS